MAVLTRLGRPALWYSLLGGDLDPRWTGRMMHHHKFPSFLSGFKIPIHGLEIVVESRGILFAHSMQFLKDWVLVHRATPPSVPRVYT
jgi:hypothetical protein